MEEDILQQIEAFPVMKGIPSRCVGPLIPLGEKISAGNLEQQENVRRWLETKKDTSVVYVSFGSIGFPAPEQTAEIAQALLKLNQPFIWSLNARQHCHLPEEIREKLAEQFDAEDSRFLLLSWAPQKLILQHPATAVFLSHCGWNSTFESLTAGVPVVAWPMFGDQKINAEWLTQRSTASFVEGTGIKPTRVVPAKEIEDVMRRVGWTPDGLTNTTFRTAAQTWSAKMQKAISPEGSSHVAFQELIAFPDEV